MGIAAVSLYFFLMNRILWSDPPVEAGAPLAACCWRCCCCSCSCRSRCVCVCAAPGESWGEPPPAPAGCCCAPWGSAAAEACKWLGVPVYTAVATGWLAFCDRRVLSANDGQSENQPA